MSIHFCAPFAMLRQLRGLDGDGQIPSLIHVPSFASTRRCWPIFVERPVSCTRCGNSSVAALLVERSRDSRSAWRRARARSPTGSSQPLVQIDAVEGRATRGLELRRGHEARVGGEREAAPAGAHERADEGDARVPRDAVGDDGVGRRLEARDVGDLASALEKPGDRVVAVAAVQLVVAALGRLVGGRSPTALPFGVERHVVGADGHASHFSFRRSYERRCSFRLISYWNCSFFVGTR
jgi:hypothetical protein